MGMMGKVTYTVPPRSALQGAFLRSFDKASRTLLPSCSTGWSPCQVLQFHHIAAKNLKHCNKSTALI